MTCSHSSGSHYRGWVLDRICEIWLGLRPKLKYARQPDLRVPLARKLAALAATLSEARNAGATFMTLAKAAEHFGCGA